MDIHLLRTFLAVADHKGLRKAADVLHITPSAVSSRVRQLEREMGVQLFDRNRAGVELTLAGQRMREKAATLIKDWLQLKQEVRRDDSNAVCLRLGAPDVIWQTWLQSKLVAFSRSVPNMDFMLKTGGRQELASMLISGQLDCVLLTESLSHPDFECRCLTSLEVVFVASPDIAQRKAKNMERYAEVDWGEAFRGKIAAYFKVIPVPVADINVAWLGVEWLLSFGGTAWLPRNLVSRHLESGDLYVVEGIPSLMLDVYIAYSVENLVAEGFVRSLNPTVSSDAERC